MTVQTDRKAELIFNRIVYISTAKSSQLNQTRYTEIEH